MKLKFFIFHFSFSIFLIGCAVKTTPVYVNIVSPKIKISDEGFLKESFFYKKLIIYKAGSKPIELTLRDNKICINKECFNKYMFMKEYFNGLSKDFFDKILNKKPLSLKFYKKTKNGFFQKSDTLFYKVTKNSVLFRDRKNKIVILIKNLKEKK